MPDCHLIPGRNYLRQAVSLAKHLNAKMHTVSYKEFPDGELYARITDPETLAGARAIVANTMYPRQNDSFIETLMLINAAKNRGVEEIIAFIPYIAYARQDKVFLEGEPVTIDVVLNSIRAAGAEYLITVDIHNPESLRSFGGQYYNILVSDMLVEEALKHVENPVIIAPDKGALNRARYAAEKHGLEYDYLVKHRDRVTGEVRVEPKELSIKGRDIVIVDDIISTGGTIAKAAHQLLSNGAAKVVVAATHGLLIGEALSKIKGSGVSWIVLADTLGTRFSDEAITYIDVSRVIADLIRERIK